MVKERLKILVSFTGLNYGRDHKIKHFACHRDFLVHEIPRIKHTQNASFSDIKHFGASHWLKIG